MRRRALCQRKEDGERELLGEPSAELRSKLTGPEPQLFTSYLSLKPR